MEEEGRVNNIPVVEGEGGEGGQGGKKGSSKHLLTFGYQKHE